MIFFRGLGPYVRKPQPPHPIFICTRLCRNQRQHAFSYCQLAVASVFCKSLVELSCVRVAFFIRSQIAFDPYPTFSFGMDVSGAFFP